MPKTVIAGGEYWQVADGWKTREEAIEHMTGLQKHHSDYEFRVFNSEHKFGDGNWLVLYRTKDHENA